MPKKTFSFKGASLPSNDLIIYNSVFTSFEDFNSLKRTSGASDKVYIKIKGKIMELKPASKISNSSIAMGKVFRQTLEIVELGEENVNFEYMYDKQPPKSNLTHISFIIEIRERRPNQVTVDEKEISEEFKRWYSGTPINKGQILFLNYQTMNFGVIADKLQINPNNPLDVDEDSQSKYGVAFGFISSDTDIEFISKEENLRIKSQKMKAKNVTKLGFKFEEMGVGGWDKEIGNIFRRVFTSRWYPSQYLAKYGIKHVKGMLLYGPPGTGKTWIARTWAEALNVKEFKVVNGPELFDKYVGETEKKIREWFTEAEKDQKENGDDAGLHVIAFDEIDSICRARGTINSGTGVHDGAVNQWLTKIDGVDSLNDIIVIGMTNRKDLIDEAILRPGRMELHIEIGLPDEKGRWAIFKIHTKEMFKNKVIDENVDLNELAKITKNYTGSDIESWVKLACSNALSREGNFNSEKIDFKTIHKVTMQNFMDAVNEIQPMFGINSSELVNCLQFGMINYGENYQILSNKINSIFTQIKNSTSISLLSVLLEGSSGCGKTALASYLALHSGFPYVKIISPESLVKYMEGGKYTAISNIFEDGYKSPGSVIILDNIEKWIEYIKIGPRFSNLLLQTILVYIKKLPPKKEKKMLIIGTTSMSSNWEEWGLVEAFDRVIHVPNLKKDEIYSVLNNYDCEPKEKEKIANLVQNSSIKQLCFWIDRAWQKGNKLMYENFSSEYQDYVIK